MTRMKACPVCGQNVGLDKLESHVKKVHPKENVDIQLDEKEQKEMKAAKKVYKPSSAPSGRWLVLVAAIVVIIIVLAFVFFPQGGRVPSDFTLTPSDSVEPWNLKSHIGSKPILLEFMHPDCHVCKDEVDVSSPGHPAYGLDELYQGYSTRVEIISIAIVLDNPTFRNPPTAQMMNDFRQQYDTWWTYLVDSGTSVRDAYGITGTPTFFLIGKLSTGGKIIYSQAYGGDLTTLRGEIDKELARP